MSRPVTESEIQRMYDLYQQIHSFKLVGQALGRNPDTVSKYVKIVEARHTLIISKEK